MRRARVDGAMLERPARQDARRSRAPPIERDRRPIVRPYAFHGITLQSPYLLDFTQGHVHRGHPQPPAQRTRPSRRGQRRGSSHHPVRDVRDARGFDGADLLKLHLRVPEIVEDTGTITQQHGNNVELELV